MQDPKTGSDLWAFADDRQAQPFPVVTINVTERSRHVRVWASCPADHGRTGRLETEEYDLTAKPVLGTLIHNAASSVGLWNDLEPAGQRVARRAGNISDHDLVVRGVRLGMV